MYASLKISLCSQMSLFLTVKHDILCLYELFLFYQCSIIVGICWTMPARSHLYEFYEFFYLAVGNWLLYI